MMKKRLPIELHIVVQHVDFSRLKKKQKICELVGNEGARIGGKRKMRPLHVGADLSRQILSEFYFWCKKK